MNRITEAPARPKKGNQRPDGMCPYTGDVPPSKTEYENLVERYRDNPALRTRALYTLLVPVISAIVDGTVPKRSNMKPAILRRESEADRVRKLTGVTTFSDLRMFMVRALRLSSRQYLESPLNPNIEVLNSLASQRAGSLETLLDQGIHTAIDAMCTILEAIPGAYQRKYNDPEINEVKLMSIARRNFPFLVAQAKRHLSDLSIISESRDSRHSAPFQSISQYLELDENDKLHFSEIINERLSSEFGKMEASDKWGKRETIGCPGLRSRAIRSLWEWHLEFAEDIYRRNLSNYGRSIIPSTSRPYNANKSQAAAMI